MSHDTVERLLDRWEKAREVGHAIGLDELCQDHPHVRDEVARKIASLRAIDGLIAGDAGRAGGVGGDVAVGGHVGPYRLIAQIGEGGMGVVFRAEQREPLRRLVALKVIKAGMDTKQVFARFTSERQALALMDHPHIARVFDAGATATGRPYFAMELVHGLPITEYCDRAKMGVGDRLRLFADVCHGVQHAHQKGVIHRDLKPTNILVAELDGRPAPKIIDFGIAKAIEQPLTDRSLYTEFGRAIGTPEYMSPEQATLAHGDVDTRSDVYALGVLLYELLTGTTPLASDRRATLSQAEWQRVVAEEEPVRPSLRVSASSDRGVGIIAPDGMTPRRLNGVLRGELDWIVMRALEKDRKRRYPTALSLATDVSRFLRDEPVEASPPSRMYVATKFVRRHRIGVTAAAAAALTVFAGAVTYIWVIRAANARETASRLLAEERRQDAELNKVWADESGEFLYGGLLIPMAETIREGLSEPGSATQSLTALRGAMADRVEQAVASAKDPPGRLDVTHANASLRGGDVLFQLGEPRAAIDAYRQAKQQFDRVPPGQAPLTALMCDAVGIRIRLARALVVIRDLGPARGWLEEAATMLPDEPPGWPAVPDPAFRHRWALAVAWGDLEHASSDGARRAAAHYEEAVRRARERPPSGPDGIHRADDLQLALARLNSVQMEPTE